MIQSLYPSAAKLSELHKRQCTKAVSSTTENARETKTTGTWLSDRWKGALLSFDANVAVKVVHPGDFLLAA